MHFKFTPLSLYPKANENRLHGNNKTLTPVRKNFLKAAYINFLLLQILFFALFCYIFGSLYQQTDRIHALDILFVDYDGGSIGQAVRDAYETMKGDGYPTLREVSPSDVQIGSLRDEVCSSRYWAAFWISPGASARLDSAMGGFDAANYNRSDVLTYIWNEALYPTIVDSAIAANLQTLVDAARIIHSTNSSFGSVDSTNPAAIAVFTNPWTLENINIQPTSQGSRLIYNTLVIILILIQEFFYLGTINGLYAQFKIYTKVYPLRIIVYRYLISLSYTFIGSLCVVGSIWIFKVGWNVNGNQFVLSWVVLWLFAHLNFLAMDLFTVWLAAQYVPMALITWVILNVASILLPFQLSNGFYRWAYALPAHEVYQILIDIWSRGCNPQLHYALPILFVWELIGLVFSAMGVYRRCHYAVIAEEVQQQAFKDKVDAALAFEKKELREVLETRRSLSAVEEAPVEKESEQEGGEDAEERERRKIEEEIRNEENNLRREQTRASKACTFGPSFGFSTYGPGDERGQNR